MARASDFSPSSALKWRIESAAHESECPNLRDDLASARRSGVQQNANQNNTTQHNTTHIRIVAQSQTRTRLAQFVAHVRLTESGQADVSGNE